MLETNYKARAAGRYGDVLEVTLPIAWRRYYRVKAGDMIRIFEDGGFLIILPPHATERQEEEARRFLEGNNSGLLRTEEERGDGVC